MQEDLRENFNIVINGDVFYDKKLPANAQLLYGVIGSLCNKNGYCWAGNEYLAKLFEKDERSIYNWIKVLVEGGYVFVINEPESGDYPGRRRLYISRMGFEAYKAECNISGKPAIGGFESERTNSEQIQQSEVAEEGKPGKNFHEALKKITANHENNFKNNGKNFPLYNKDKLINSNISSSEEKEELEFSKSCLFENLKAQYAEEKKGWGEDYAAFRPDIPEEVSSFLGWLYSKTIFNINGVEMPLKEVLKVIKDMTLEQFWDAYDTVFSVNKTAQIFCKEMYLLTCLYNKVLSGM